MKRATIITWEQLRVGGIILAALAIVTLAIVKLGATANLFTARYELTTFLGSAPGLRPGGSVSVAGQLAGTVKRIDFLPADGDTTRTLRLVLSVDQTLKEQIREDSRVRVKNLGLLGDKVLDISPGTVPHAVLEAGDTLVATPALDYDLVIEQAANAVTDVVQLTGDIRQITSGVVRGDGTMGQLIKDRTLYDRMVATLNRTNQAIARVQAPNGTLGKLIDDPRLYEQMVASLGRVDSLVARASSKQGSFGLLLSDTTLYRNFVNASTELRTLVQNLSTGDGTAAKLIRDPAVYDELRRAITSFNTMLADMQKDPKRYFRGIITVF